MRLPSAVESFASDASAADSSAALKVAELSKRVKELEERVKEIEERVALLMSDRSAAPCACADGQSPE